MKSKTSAEKREKVGRRSEPRALIDEATGEEPKPAERDLDDDDPDEDDLQRPDDGRWDVFILDDSDGEPLPDYGDFWFPD